MSWLLILLFACSSPTPPPTPTPAPTSTPDPRRAVWIDVDTSAGLPGKDVDDALALVQAFRMSSDLDIRGVSTVFGNAPIEDTDRITRELVARFGPEGLPVHRGAANPEDADTPAVEAITVALDRERLTVLVLGPATNLAHVVRNRPDLARRIDEVVAVAGRRPGQRFTTGTKSTRAHRDFNFEQDPGAFATLLGAVPLTLAPWEVSRAVWIEEPHLAQLASGDAAAQWLAAAAPSWMARWKESLGVDGFNPYDTLAVERVGPRSLLDCEQLPIRIEEHPDDRTPESMRGTKTKPYLVVGGGDDHGAMATYCHSIAPAFRDRLVLLLAGQG